MSRLVNLHPVMVAFEKAKIKGGTVKASVAYTTSYAMIVHEDMHAFHPVGQAKYLEEPARIYQSQISAIVTKNMKAKWYAFLGPRPSLENALYEGAKFLYKVSQNYVPVDTGKLKASGSITIETK